MNMDFIQKRVDRITNAIKNIPNLTLADVRHWAFNNAIYLVLAALLTVIVILEPGFLNPLNFRNILTQASTRMIIALGVGALIIAEGTDLSAGRAVGLSALVSSSMLQAVDYAYKFYPDLPELPIIVPFLLAISATAFFGFLNGVVIAKFKVTPFIATLGMMIILYGVGSIYFESQALGASPIGGLASKYTELVQGKVLGIPNLILFASLAILVIWFVWNKTKFGKNIYAIGGNSEAAAVSGVNIARNLIMVYTLAGLMYGIAGFLEAARIGSATNNTGLQYELDAIAACVVGGLSFSGGIGKISGVVAGVLIFQVIAYGLAFIGVSVYYQFIVKGLIIILAVALDTQKYIKKK
jgi:methyl-galactoside transport system permease protein